MAQARENSNEYNYPMTHSPCGKFIIINNEDFKKYSSGWPNRPGTDGDARRLERTFRNLNFSPVIHSNKTKDEMVDIIDKVAKQSHSNYDCLGIAILTHGGQTNAGRDLLVGVDGGEVELEELLRPLKDPELSEINHLVGKPKIIFVQACRGIKLDCGVEVPISYYIEFDQSMSLGAGCGQAMEVTQLKVRLPIEADFLYHFSTATGYFAWRNTVKGAVFIKYLCQVLDEKSDGIVDLASLLVRVNYEVATNFEARCRGIDVAKQTPVVQSQLRKSLVLPVRQHHPNRPCRLM